MNKNGNRYYRHPWNRGEGCALKRWVPASLMENSVLIHLLQTFGDVERLQQAVEKATPDIAKIEKLAEEQGSLSQELKKIAVRKEKLVDAVADATLPNPVVKERMGKLLTREDQIESRLATIEEQLENAPDPAKVKRLSKLGMRVLKSATRERPEMVFEKPYEWKRNLAEHAFAGRDAKKQRLGVYVIHVSGPAGKRGLAACPR